MITARDTIFNGKNANHINTDFQKDVCNILKKDVKKKFNRNR